MFYKDSQSVYRVLPLDELEWLVHGFGTRTSVELTNGASLATLHQIHSDIVIEAGGRAGRLGEGDALIDDTPGALIGVKSADCVPLLLADGRRRVVAAVHAGWRGTARRVVQRTVERLALRYASEPSDLYAAIGPAIGECCYQVGPEVAREFAAFDPQLGGVTAPAHLNLAAVNRRQLIESGVREARIYCAGLCTKCETGDFHSWRRDGQRAGRMVSVVGVK